jgi:hypothetical protein
MSSRFAFVLLRNGICCSLAFGASLGIALAQVPAATVYLNAAEIKDALVDKPWTGSRGVYGALTQINYRSDHSIEILNVDTSATRKGHWDIDARGQMCVTWSVSAATTCYLYTWSGAKLVAYEAGDPLTPHAELQRRRPPN